ncbi:GntR family transcriptional regulator [bacterium]|nr:GntR family transcriptional regulator [bacterium]
MNLFLNRTSPIALIDQLTAQIRQQVASGALSPGEKLPSLRSLAQRLGIHHNTALAAYKALEAEGVIEIRQGSGARVRAFAPAREPWREGVALRALAAHFVAQARSRGHDAEAILEACRAALDPVQITRLAVVNPHPDLQALYLHELGDWLSLPMVGMSPEEVEAADAAWRTETCFVTSSNHALRLQQILGDDAPLAVFKLASVEPLLARAKAVEASGLIALVSDSPRFRFLIQELLAGACEADQLLVLAAEDEDQLRSVARLASLIVTDSPCWEAVSKLSLQAPYRFRLLAEDLLSELAERLPPEAFNPR